MQTMEDTISLRSRTTSAVVLSLLSAASGIHQRVVARRQQRQKAEEESTQQERLKTTQMTSQQSSLGQKEIVVKKDESSSSTASVGNQQMSKGRPSPLTLGLSSGSHLPASSMYPPPIADHSNRSQDDSDTDSSEYADTTCSTTSGSSEDVPSCPGTPLHRTPVPYLLTASVSRQVAITLTCVLAIGWIMSTGWRQRMRALYQATAFAIIEFHFTGWTDDSAKRYWPPSQVAAWRTSGMRALEKVAHALHFSMSSAPKPLRKIWRSGYTTWEMFGASVLWMPIFSEFYFGSLFPGDSWLMFVCRIVFYPLNVWIMETMLGYFLSRVWGRRAWWYRDTWARFDGNITLKYGHYWVVMGLFHSLSYQHWEVPLSEAVGEFLGVM